jgi:hypothetical protein
MITANHAAAAHALAKHGHQDTPELREILRGGLQDAEPALEHEHTSDL